MKWIGQHIVGFIARFRSDVYFEGISTGTIASGGNLGLDSNNKIVKANEDGATLTQEQVEDYAGALVATGGTKTGISVTYQDGTGDMDFVVDHDTATNFAANEHYTQANIVATGVLNSGSITSGFGNIDNGSSTLDTGALTAATVTVTTEATIPKRKFSISSTTDNNLAQGDVLYYGGGSTTAGNICYMTTAGQWADAQADAAATSIPMVAIALGTDPDVDGMLIRGTYTLDHDVADSQGIPLYISATAAGQITRTVPSSSGDIARVVAYNLGDDDEIFFCPDNTWVEIA